MATSAERAAKWLQSRIDAQLCLTCPNPVTRFRRCLACRAKRAEYIRNLPYKEQKREIQRRRVQHRVDNGLCISCGVSSYGYRCDKCSAKHRASGNKSYRKNRDSVLVRSAIQRTLSRLNHNTDMLLSHVRNFMAVAEALNENKKNNAAGVAPSQGQRQ